MAKRDLSSILGDTGPDRPGDPAAERDDDVGVPEPRPSRPNHGPLWQFLGRDRMTSISRCGGIVRYKRLVERVKGQSPAVVIAALHDELVWAYPRLNGVGRPQAGNDLPPADPDRIDWDVAALTIDKINHQLQLAVERSPTWAAAITADVERRDL